MSSSGYSNADHGWYHRFTGNKKTLPPNKIIMLTMMDDHNDHQTDGNRGEQLSHQDQRQRDHL